MRDLTEYLEACRKKRNIVEYDYVGGATRNDALELISSAEELKSRAVEWLATQHPDPLGTDC